MDREYSSTGSFETLALLLLKIIKRVVLLCSVLSSVVDTRAQPHGGCTGPVDPLKAKPLCVLFFLSPFPMAPKVLMVSSRRPRSRRRRRTAPSLMAAPTVQTFSRSDRRLCRWRRSPASRSPSPPPSPAAA
jgi:hypothetical protein